MYFDIFRVWPLEGQRSVQSSKNMNKENMRSHAPQRKTIPLSHSVSYRFVHLELYIVLVAEQFIRSRRGELFCCMCQKQEVVKEEGPQLFVALHLVHLERDKWNTSHKCIISSTVIQWYLQNVNNNMRTVYFCKCFPLPTYSVMIVVLLYNCSASSRHFILKPNI